MSSSNNPENIIINLNMDQSIISWFSHLMTIMYFTFLVIRKFLDIYDIDLTIHYEKILAYVCRNKEDTSYSDIPISTPPSSNTKGNTKGKEKEKIKKEN